MLMLKLLFPVLYSFRVRKGICLLYAYKKDGIKSVFKQSSLSFHRQDK